ncbi:Outer-membrane lipoprotein carrier protein [Candidatus Erwinia haradaeae]|uniref:Outer-membrane lipoprotein carrier protein n=1 Tax=Candidatus Erwinia haradaeae TaxID=1922217 RepID=A0A451DJ44_9GAMM|nr:Outer-membrane lipoprotein carrier protein [Candidatus Erwinia haradaeae]
MNKILIVICLLIIPGVSSSMQCDIATVLQKRLEKIQSFHTEFNQTVIDKRNILIQKSHGYVWVNRPDQLYWKVLYPDSSDLISDGKTLWFYNPSVKQVSIYCVKNILQNTPLMLVSCHWSNAWKRYHLLQKGDTFIFIPKELYSNIKKFTLNILKNGNINRFSIFERDGVCIRYVLAKQNPTEIDPKKFQFSIPPGVTIDDHR